MTAADSKIEGGCLCGALRYHATRIAAPAAYCHCRSCRKVERCAGRSRGSPSRATASSFTQGEPRCVPVVCPRPAQLLPELRNAAHLRERQVPRRARHHDRESRRARGVPAERSRLDQPRDSVAADRRHDPASPEIPHEGVSPRRRGTTTMRIGIPGIVSLLAIVYRSARQRLPRGPGQRPRRDEHVRQHHLRPPLRDLTPVSGR